MIKQRKKKFTKELLVERVKEISDRAIFIAPIVSHFSCLGRGIYSGFMNASGLGPEEMPFGYFWGANTIATGVSSAFAGFSEEKSGLDIRRLREQKNLVIGGVIGAVTAPIEYLVGCGIGYLAKRFS